MRLEHEESTESSIGTRSLRTCSHEPAQVSDPGANFALVYGLTPVTVHMSFLLPRGNFERRVTRCTTPGNPPCRGNFSLCEQNAKVARGKSSLAHAHYQFLK